MSKWGTLDDQTAQELYALGYTNYDSCDLSEMVDKVTRDTRGTFCSSSTCEPPLQGVAPSARGILINSGLTYLPACPQCGNKNVFHTTMTPAEFARAQKRASDMKERIGRIQDENQSRSERQLAQENAKKARAEERAKKSEIRKAEKAMKAEAWQKKRELWFAKRQAKKERATARAAALRC